MKEKVLMFLLNCDEYISGEEISQKLGVTRACIWKSIKKLQQEGYIIESSTKKGYKLIDKPNVVTSLEIKHVLTTKWMGQKIFFFDQLDSTNAKVKELERNGEQEGVLVVAEKQSACKGRLGKSWDSPAGTGIWMSLLLKPNIVPSKASQMTLLLGLCLCEAISEVTGLEAGIKWPNDIVINGKKVAGILAEMSAEIEKVKCIVVGIGINVNQESFPSELPYASSLLLEGGKEYDRKQIIASFLSKFEGVYESYQEQPELNRFLERYEKVCITLHKKVKIISNDKECIAEARRIDSDGELIVVDEQGNEKKVFTGEVSVRGIYGYV